MRRAPARVLEMLWVSKPQVTEIAPILPARKMKARAPSSRAGPFKACAMRTAKASQGADQVEPWLDDDFRDPPGQTHGYGHSCNLPHAGEDQFTVVEGTTGGEN